jgi:hypothetical protein
VYNVKGFSSALQALELARRIGLISKLKPAFNLNSYYVVLLTYYVIKTKLVMLRNTS